jgi:plasmid stability protein
MANVTIRDVPEDVLRALKRRARRHGVSLDDAVNQIFVDAVLAQNHDFLRWVSENRLPLPEGMDVVENLRKDRDR